MGMLEIAQAAVKRIRTDPNGFTKRLTFTKKDGSVSAIIYGMFSKIHMTTGTDGEAINTKRPHVSIAESALNDLGYTTRDANNECNLKDDKIFVADSTLVSSQYIIAEIFPDETLGIIVCFLRDFE